ncbi:LINE-1 type transposase domain-containing protein 1 [Elysia marginata]|uniref:LINE-1 type transposase domain-containing protein 1 n=1 Tax=Elysia marginata TaxID=1093978 RepID=A0AAV4EFA8_9GAST|nr:LINE-1 type transposase domain-containing protein 1 [Elysia marginata]
MVAHLETWELLKRSKSSCRVHGHTANAGGDFLLGYDVTFLDGIVTDLFRGRLGLTHFDPQTIDVAHRIGPFKKEYDRAVIVRFITHRAANEVLAKRRALKGSGITIAEDLTPTNAAKFPKFREIKSVQRAWTKRGEIYVKREDGLVLKVGPRDTVEDITKRLLTQTRSTHQKQNKHSAILQHAQPDKPKTQTHTGGTSTRKDREKSRSPANVTNYSATTYTPEPTASVVCPLASTPCERVDSPTQELDHINVTPVQKRLISMAGALNEEGCRKND